MSSSPANSPATFNLPRRSVLKALAAAPTAVAAVTGEAFSFSALEDEWSESLEKPERHAPPNLNAGNLIARVRAHGEACKAAITFEASLADGTPESDAATATSDLRTSELEKLRDEIIAGLNNRDPRNRDNPYSFTGLEEYTVLCELITAICPWFWTDISHGDALPVFAELRKSASYWSERFLEQAENWNASQGGANV